MMDLHGKTAGIYKRASRDTATGSSMEGLSVDSQEEEGLVSADDLGVKVVDVYDDNDTAASKFAAKQREDWPRMLADIESGRLEVIIVWDTSRGSRTLTEWSLFLDLIEAKAVLFHVVSHERTYNPRNHRDWETLASEGVKSASFSNLLSANIKRGKASARRRGRPASHAPFGWRRVYDPESGRMVTQEPVESEQVILRSIYERLLSGESLWSVTRDLTRRTELATDDPEWVPLTRRGNRWQPGALRYLVLNPVHIGKFYDGDELRDGNWSGTIDEDTWWRVHKLLNAPDRKRLRPTRTKHLLTQTAECGSCGSAMGSASAKGVPRLECRGRNADGSPKAHYGCTSIRMSWVDHYVKRIVVGRLCDRDLVGRLCAQDSEEQRQALARSAEIRADIDTMRELSQSRAIKPRDYGDYLAQWEPEAERLERVASAGIGAGAVLALGLQQLADEAGVEGDELFELMWDAFEETPLPGQRELVKTFTDWIRIHKGFNGAHVFDSDRVEVK